MEWYKNNEQDYFRLWQEITPNWVNLSVLPHDLLHKGTALLSCGIDPLIIRSFCV